MTSRRWGKFKPEESKKREDCETMVRDFWMILFTTALEVVVCPDILPLL